MLSVYADECVGAIVIAAMDPEDMAGHIEWVP